MEVVKLILTIVEVVAALFLILVVLLQSGKSAGIAGAIGGGMDTFLSKNKAKSWDARLAPLDQVGCHRLHDPDPGAGADPVIGLN